MSRMRKTHVRFCESKENRVAPYFLATRFYGNYEFKTKVFRISSPKIPKEFDGFTILHLSDLHNISYGKGNKKLIKAVNSGQADAIFYTGDMVDEHNFNKRGFFDLIEGVHSNIQSYYVFGNHEDGLVDEQKTGLMTKLREKGIILLRNQSCKLRKNQDTIYLHGLEIPRHYLRNTYNVDGSPKLNEEELKTYLGPIDTEDDFHILLAHNALYGDTYMKAGYDVTFSGHVHGGMMRLPFIGGLFSPDRKFFPKYAKGKYELQGNRLFVSPGIGGVKGRMGNPPYIYKIILKSEKS